MSDEQIKIIAKAGNIDSLVYDATQGIKIGAYSGGISAAITFAISTWNGKNFEEALEDSINAGLKVGGIAWASSILVGQMAKAGLNSALVPASDAVIKMIGPKASAQIVNAFRSGKNIYGAAAMNNASKLLRNNFISGVATLAVMSAGDVINIFRGRISGAQLFKNVVNKGAGIGGGMLGFAFGGPVGALVGGYIFNKVSQTVTDELIEDDSKEMLRILESEFKNVANDYLLNKSECEKISDRLRDKLDGGDKLKDMYASSNRYSFARDLLENCTEPVVRSRKKIHLPSTENYVRGLKIFWKKILKSNKKILKHRKNYIKWQIIFISA